METPDSRMARLAFSQSGQSRRVYNVTWVTALRDIRTDVIANPLPNDRRFF
jgi:hypothetical protein